MNGHSQCFWSRVNPVPVRLQSVVRYMGGGMLWCLFLASRTVFYPRGTVMRRLNGKSVWRVSRLVAAFRFCKSTVLRRLPSFLETVIILEHHFVGVPAGTGSMMLSATFVSSCDLTAFQWWGTGMGVYDYWLAIVQEQNRVWFTCHGLQHLVSACVKCTVGKITFNLVFQLFTIQGWRGMVMCL